MLEQRWKIVRHFFENHGNVAEYMRKLLTDFEKREAPSATYVRFLWKKWKKLASSSKNQSTKSQKQCVHQRILLLWQKACAKRHEHQCTVVLNKWTFRRHHWDEFSKKPWYDENWLSNPFSLRLVSQRSTYRRCRFGKKNSSFQIILILAGI